MNEKQATPKSNGVQFPNVHVVGKLINVITHQTQNGNIYEHVINMPAANEYDYPPGVTVKASNRLGNPDEHIDIIAICRRRGYKSNGSQRFSHEFWHVDSSKSNS